MQYAQRPKYNLPKSTPPLSHTNKSSTKYRALSTWYFCTTKENTKYLFTFDPSAIFQREPPSYPTTNPTKHKNDAINVDLIRRDSPGELQKKVRNTQNFNKDSTQI